MIDSHLFQHRVRTMMVLGIVWFGSLANAQCVLNALQGLSYGQSTCGTHLYQYATGTVSTAYGECGGLFFSSPLTDQDVSTSIQDREKNVAISWYPNPVKDNLFLHANEEVIGQCQIIAMDGTILQQLPLYSSLHFHIDVSMYPPGFYLILTRLQSGDRFIHKIIKSN